MSLPALEKESLAVQGQLAETHVQLGQQLQAEGALKEAEGHYVEGGDWKGAVQMYRLAGMWDSSLRLAKTHGGPLATKQVALQPTLPVTTLVQWTAIPCCAG